MSPLTAQPSPVAMDLLSLITTQIAEEFEKLVQQCEQANGVEAAQELRQSITEIAIGVKSVNGDPNHWLVKHLDEQVFTNNSEIYG